MERQRKTRVLVIDDDKLLLREIQDTLSLNDYDVVAMNHPADATEVIERVQPDVILLDLVMPDESGFQVACKINYFSGLARIPIIAMTGYFKDSYLPLMSGYGIKDYLKKPFDPLELIAKIESVV